MSQSYIPAELRRQVRDHSKGCCEYCKVSESFSLALHWIDHVVAVKHGGEAVASNLAFSCKLCNQHKGTDLSSIDPQNGEIVRLYNPRTDVWSEHFELVDAEMRAITAIGRVAVRLLQLNQIARVRERAALVAAGLLDLRPL